MKDSIQQKMFKGINRWKQSGLSQKDWCERNHVSYATFHYWYRRYRNLESFMEEKSEGFVRLMVGSDGSTDGWCELSVPDGRRLVFHQAVGADFLKQLMS
jgi:hypothetical protein